MQHANIELIFYEDLPLASLPLKEYERKGSATLVGSFYSTVETQVSVREKSDKSTVGHADPPIISNPDEIGELLYSGFVPAEPTNARLIVLTGGCPHHCRPER